MPNGMRSKSNQINNRYKEVLMKGKRNRITAYMLCFMLLAGIIAPQGIYTEGVHAASEKAVASKEWNDVEDKLKTKLGTGYNEAGLCTGFLYWALKNAYGVDWGDNSYVIDLYNKLVDKGISKVAEGTSGKITSDMKPGDIVIFFLGDSGIHCAILGEGGKLYHATTSGGVQYSPTLSEWMSYAGDDKTSDSYVVFRGLNSTGSLSIIKKSDNTDITKGNSCYSLKGAKYGLYKGDDLIGTLITDEDGKASLDNIPYGSYVLKEIEASKGYAVDETEYKIKVDNQTTKQTVKETPQGDPAAAVIYKIDEDTHETWSASNLPQGSAKLAGAEYTVKYYDGYYTSSTDFNNITPTRTWVIKTNENGKTMLTESLLVRGDDFYYSSSGAVTLPLGTLTIQETKAPEGYLLDSTLHVQQIKPEGKLEGVHTYNIPVHKETVIKGGVKINKTDTETGASQQGNATFKSAQFSIINDSTNPVEVDGKKYGKGAVVKVITTNDNSIAQTSADCLPYGDYIIRETKAPAGYLNTGTIEHKFSIRKDGEIIDLTKTPMINDVIRGGVKIRKNDTQTGEKEQGSATFKGAEFTIINKSTNPVKVDGKIYKAEEVVKVLVTGEDGTAQTSADLLPYGKYLIKETKVPKGYTAKGAAQREAAISEDGKIVDLTTSPIINDVIRGGVKIRKNDMQTETKVQGDATFEGAEFSIINRSKASVIVEGREYAAGDVVKIITTDKDGVAQTAADTLPYGEYTIKETKAPTGYLNEGVIERDFNIRLDGEIVDMTGEPVINDVIRGGMQLQKWDRELGASEALGGGDYSQAKDGAKLTGIEFTITNKSKAAVIVDGKEYAPDEVIAVLSTAWNEEIKAYSVETPNDYLPYGTYEVKETKTNKSYLLTDGKARTFEIREHGKIVTFDKEETELTFRNFVVRGDLELVKVEDTSMKRMAGIPFKLTNTVTGECHVIVTDDNGYVSTESKWNKHTENTNANDKLLEMEEITAEDVDDTAGVWFGLGEFGSMAQANDTLGAIPYGTYILDEMRCENNAEHELIQNVEIKVSRNDAVIHLGTITNDISNTEITPEEPEPDEPEKPEPEPTKPDEPEPQEPTEPDEPEETPEPEEPTKEKEPQPETPKKQEEKTPEKEKDIPDIVKTGDEIPTIVIIAGLLLLLSAVVGIRAIARKRELAKEEQARQKEKQRIEDINDFFK